MYVREALCTIKTCAEHMFFAGFFFHVFCCDMEYTDTLVEECSTAGNAGKVQQVVPCFSSELIHANFWGHVTTRAGNATDGRNLL